MKGIILDHSQTARMILAEELRSPGWEWILESDPENVWDILENEEIHLLSTSQELESMNGLDLIRRIRSKSFASPIISLVSSYVDKEFVEKAYEVGADLVIPKSFNPGDLKTCFHRILQPGKSLDTILIIDDSPLVRKIITHSMNKSPFHIIEADSMNSAIQIIDKEIDHIAIVISDENMEGGNGSDLCYAIRKNAKLASLPFFLSSGEDISELESIRDGIWFNGCFTKPLDREIVIQAAQLFQMNWYSHRMNFRTTLPQEYLPLS